MTFDLQQESTTALAPSGVRPDFPLRVSSRIGAWGALVGIGASLANALGLSTPYWILGPVSGLGFLVGGLGITVASALVLRRTKGSMRTLRLGAMAGLPFGLFLTARAALYLWFPQWAMDHLHLYSLLMTGALGLGVALVILFVVGLLKNVEGNADSEAEYI